MTKNTIELHPEETEHGVSYAIQKFKVEEETALSLRRHFEPFESQAKEWKEKASTIVVDNENQLTEMEEARKARLALRSIRIGYEKLHKDLKEDSLRKGQLLDLIKRELNKMVEPIEAHLEQQEKFIEIQEANRKQKLYQERCELLMLYMDAEVVKSMPLAEMSQEVFDNFLTGQRLAKESKEREEQERIERERKEAVAKAVEDKRIRAENEQLQKERDKLEEKNRKERDQRRQVEAELEAKARKEREKRRAAEAELAAAAAVEAEKKKREQAERRKAARQPDKMKLLTLADQIESLKCNLESEEAQRILFRAAYDLAEVVKYIRNSANKL